jgi:hypothetical protein
VDNGRFRRQEAIGTGLELAIFDDFGTDQAA